MSFISGLYLLFLAATWLGFYKAPASKRMPVLLVASYIFYAVWSVPFLALIQVTTTVDFYCANRICATDNPVVRKRWLGLGIIQNLLVLCCFKYLNFLISCQHTILSYVGLNTPCPHLNIILPLGISFYTFEAISYLVDVYRGTKPAPNWLTYNFYIMFFPHLVAGPIIRFNKFFPQYASGIQLPDWNRIKSAFELIIVGFALKLIVADGAALVCSDLFRRSASLSSLDALVASGGFIIQVWLDFQGYTNIARGTALLFNIDLPVNFRLPNNASNIADFWQRWNITLSRWLFDYVYVPMGGAKRAVLTRMRVAFLTMFIAGIWHGAGMNYVLMGAYFGALVSGYHAYRSLLKYLPPKVEQLRRQSRVYHLLSCLLTIYLLLPAGMLFNPNLTVDLAVISKILPAPSFFQGLLHDVFCQYHVAPMLLIAVLLLAIVNVQPTIISVCRRLYNPLPLWLRVQAVTVVIALCVIFEAQQTDPTFMYAQF